MADGQFLDISQRLRNPISCHSLGTTLVILCNSMAIRLQAMVVCNRCSHPRHGKCSAPRSYEFISWVESGYSWGRPRGFSNPGMQMFSDSASGDEGSCSRTGLHGVTAGENRFKIVGTLFPIILKCMLHMLNFEVLGQSYRNLPEAHYYYKMVPSSRNMHSGTKVRSSHGSAVRLLIDAIYITMFR